MKLVNHFSDFLKNVVNLNQTRVNLLTTSEDAVKNAITNGAWGPEIISFEVQGSWAHETIIKPVQGKEFDADLLVVVNPVDEWTPKDYINKLHSTLNANANYQGKVHRYSHCVTIEYAGDKRIDIAPCVKGRVFTDGYEVCNRGTDAYETSAPLQYNEWIKKKGIIVGSGNLKKVTRLLKYLRDIKSTFTCPSFLFTTLLGNCVEEYDSIFNPFTDLPTTLKLLIGRLDDYLSTNISVPEIRNPVLHSEIQSSGWNQTQYSNFRQKIHQYRTWIDEAYDEPDKDESIQKWQRIFGPEFAASTVRKALNASPESTIVTDSVTMDHLISDDLVERVSRIGEAAIPPQILLLPHVESPSWPVDPHLNMDLSISGELKTGKYGAVIRKTYSSECLDDSYWIRFSPTLKNGGSITSGFRVVWQVVNTGRIAKQLGQLRGGFYESDTDGTRTERLQYRGVHYIEAFLIRTIDNTLVGHSEPFYVVIK